MKTNSVILYSLLCLFIIQPLQTHAQFPGWEWAQSPASPGYDNGQSVSIDETGNVYVAGHFSSATILFGGNVLVNSNPGSKSFFIVKYDPYGNVLWAKCSDGHSYYDNGLATCTDRFGNFYLTGGFDFEISFDTITLNGPSSNWDDFFIVKFDSSGNVLWARNALPPYRGSCGYDINTDSSGNVYMSGLFYGTIYIDSDTLLASVNTTYDMLLVKYNSAGQFQWAKSSDGTGIGYARCSEADKLGNVYVSGFFQGQLIFGNDTIYNSTANGIFFVRYDSFGNVVWVRHQDSESWDNPTDLLIDAAGSIYLTGTFEGDTIIFGNDTLTHSNNQATDIFLVKFDNSGIPVWAKRYGGPGIDKFTSMSMMNGNLIYLSGLFQGPTIAFDSITLINAGGICPNGCSDFFIALTDTIGNTLWAESAGGTDNDDINCIATDLTGNTYVAGSFESPSISLDTINLSNSGDLDMFVGKLNLVLTKIIKHRRDFSISIMPNPVSSTGRILIHLPAPLKGSISVYDIYGRLAGTIMENQMVYNEHSIEWDFSYLISGLYFLELRIADQVVYENFIVLE